MASKSRRIPNVNGAARGPLNAVVFADTSKAFVSAAEKNAPVQQKALVRDILNAVKQFVADSDQHQLDLDAKLSDIMLGRIASLLDEVREDFVNNELEEIKKEILDEISGISVSSILKSFLLNQVAELFDSDAKKEDIEELKEWMQKNLLKSKDNTESSDASELQFEDTTVESDEQVAEDNEKGDYKDSTPAENFFQLQSFIQSQFDQLNENLKNIPGQAGLFSKMKVFIAGGIAGIAKKVSSLGKFVAKGITSVIKGVGGIAGVLKKGAFAAISGIAAGVVGIARGVKGIISGVKGLGSKIGGAIASPFKKIGGFFSALNPFKRKKDKKEEKKQKLKDKIMEKISLVIDKIWKVIEPFIDKVLFFMKLAMITVVIPIATTLATVLLILAGIVLLAIGAYLVYKWVKSKILQFWDYVTSGEMWEDIKAGLLKAFEWMVDFGKWLWDITIKALRYIFVDMWVDLGKWTWDTLKKFGNWLYDNYIDKYIIQPLTRLIQPLANLWVEKIQPVVQPFIDSLTNLKDKIVKAFSSWDTNKSIWENLKNIGGILKQSIVDWWNNDNPFKKVYDEYVKPAFGDILNFIDIVKGAFAQWDTNKSIWENLKNIGGIIMDSLGEWWENSSIKKLWDEKLSPMFESLKAYLNDLLKPIREWYENSKLKQWIDKLIDFGKTIANGIVDWWNNTLKPKLEALKQKLGNVVWDLPMVPLFRPFGFIVGKSMTLSDKEKETHKQTEKLEKLQKELDDISSGKKVTKLTWTGKKDITAERKKEIEAEMAQLNQQLASQQVQQASQPIKQLENMQANSQAELQNDSKEIATEIQQKEEAQQQFDAAQSDKSDAMLCEIRALRKETKDTLKDPYVVPFPVLQNGNYNYAMMENN